MSTSCRINMEGDKPTSMQQIQSTDMQLFRRVANQWSGNVSFLERFIFYGECLA